MGGIRAALREGMHMDRRLPRTVGCFGWRHDLVRAQVMKLGVHRIESREPRELDTGEPRSQSARGLGPAPSKRRTSIAGRSPADFAGRTGPGRLPELSGGT